MEFREVMKIGIQLGAAGFAAGLFYGYLFGSRDDTQKCIISDPSLPDPQLQDWRDRHTYSSIPIELIERIGTLGSGKVMETCMVNIDDLIAMRREDIDAIGYGIFPKKFHIGEVEHLHSDRILMINDGTIETKKSVLAYKGDYVILGGRCEPAFLKEEDVYFDGNIGTIISTDTEFAHISNTHVLIDIYPNHKFMTENGWILQEIMFSRDCNLVECSDSPYFVHQIWERAT